MKTIGPFDDIPVELECYCGNRFWVDPCGEENLEWSDEHKALKAVCPKCGAQEKDPKADQIACALAYALKVQLHNERAKFHQDVCYKSMGCHCKEYKPFALKAFESYEQDKART